MVSFHRLAQVGCFAFVLIVALAGSSTRAAEPSEKDKSPQVYDLRKIEEALGSIAQSNREAAQPTHLERPCSFGTDNRSSDLCAQWKAADAARDAAFWTMFSAVITTIGTFGVLFAWREARKANKITATIYETDTRPIMVPAESDFRTVDSQSGIQIIFAWRNEGKLPARVIYDDSKSPPDRDFIVLAGDVYTCDPIPFTLDQLRAVRQRASSIIKYRNGVGENPTQWKSGQAVDLLPNLMSPNPEGGVFSGSRVPCPDAYRVTSCREDGSSRTVELT